MTVSADGRLSLSATAQLGTTLALARRRCSRLAKFSNGELMGKKVDMTPKYQRLCNKNVKSNICMSLTTNIAGESKLRDLEMEKRDPRTVVAIILGGGAGTRLFPLTKRRAKPAVPIGGAYRLIDVPMSNCINSGINKVYILTQFNSASLNRISLVLTTSAMGLTSEMDTSRYWQPHKLQERPVRDGSKGLQTQFDNFTGCSRMQEVRKSKTC
ncbi:hypothetical protein ES332_D09G250800v1 [Gossypium tomentosum]|uniref:glucose-1-phosphate adenylyltransferase n=1 Tax=Gossypium tomentosum TaxID=34277 RepID=A0A5D2JMG8_GOSTO|nr:hypothetical protein ES332_D09G250800v1 [Gossypium tomentosum]